MSSRKFLSLAKRFADYRSAGNLDISDTVEIAKLLTIAGEELFNSLRLRQISFASMPTWLTQAPEAKSNFGNEKGPYGIVAIWGTYWWFAVRWLCENVPESAILYPTNFKKLSREECWAEFGNAICSRMLPLKCSDEKEIKFWGDIAKVSEETCLHLAQQASRATNMEQETSPRLAEGPLTMVREKQTINFKGHRIRFSGTKNWELFLLLYKANSEVVTIETIQKETSRDKCNVVIGELRKFLRKNGGGQIAEAIQNQATVGYFLDLDSLRQS